MPAPKGNNYAAGNSGGGAPEGNSNAVGNDGGAPEGNANAMRHGRHMTPEALRAMFTEEERALYAALIRDHRERIPEYSEERAEELATIQVAESRLTRELLDSLSEGGESFPTRGLDALRAYARDLRETEDKARAEAWRRKLALLTGLVTPEDTGIDPDRLPTPEESEEPDQPETTDSPGSAPPAVERAMADGSGEPPEERATPANKGDGPEEDETDEDANTRLSRRLRYAQLNRGRGRWNG